MAGTALHVDGGTRGGADGTVVSRMERVIFASIGVTARAIADTSTARGLTLTQWRVLALVGAQREPMRLGQLASAAAMSAPSTSRLVGRLAARGLVQSRPDDVDARAVRLTLTAEGRSVVAAVVRTRRALVSHALERASSSASLRDDLLVVAAALEKISGR